MILKYLLVDWLFLCTFCHSLDRPALIQRTKSEIAIDELGLKGSSKLWIGKDYCNNIYKDFVDLNAPFEGKI